MRRIKWVCRVLSWCTPYTVSAKPAAVLTTSPASALAVVPLAARFSFPRPGFANLDAMSWSDRPTPKQAPRSNRRRQAVAWRFLGISGDSLVRTIATDK